MKEIITGIIILIILIISISIIFDYNIKAHIKKIFLRIKRNELSFLRQYTDHGSYSSDTGFYKEPISKILKVFNKKVVNRDKVFIESKFNKKYYPMFDLDDIKILDLFKKLYSDVSYAIFMSSEDHYWAFVDKPYRKLSDIFLDYNWKICNDQGYVSCSVNSNTLVIRGLYENKTRKPHLFETNEILSKNFQLFIDKLIIYYNREGFELSILKYQDSEMLIKFNRKQKLKQLSNSN
jgi:uncharacterized protein YxeA